ncbi:Dolichyl-diphosphooligosaccharide--protein glycosyltransferase subunit 4A [Capsicum baccatum]|uniref:Dolichyl-diphosphooligosaccharide--protein glycosyltransferase subunit 4A n=1 Tax=Capsicum baccatum TaxID=33114 RepID=A0A2G2XA14_CAPBA|nr:Dolichyl-diphosphooligosaccharide--protein glycosyltransferase subunit 4A [Capsicum baccatum]
MQFACLFQTNKSQYPLATFFYFFPPFSLCAIRSNRRLISSPTNPIPFDILFKTKIMDDQDLGFFANFLGIFIFVFVIAYHYVMADPKYAAN